MFYNIKELFNVFHPHSFKLVLGTDQLGPWLSLTMLLIVYCSCIAPACHRQTFSQKIFLEYILLMYNINKFQRRQITRHRLMVFNEMDSPM